MMCIIRSLKIECKYLGCIYTVAKDANVDETTVRGIFVNTFIACIVTKTYISDIR